MIDREASPFVHLIFQWAKEGVPYHQIAENLSDMRVPTPSEHYNLKHTKDCRPPACRWNSGVVRKILLNQTYTGDFVSNNFPILLPTLFFIAVLATGVLYEMKKDALNWNIPKSN